MLVDELHCELYALDARGDSVLVSFARARRLDLVVQLLLCGYDPAQELPAPSLRPLPSPPDALHLGLAVCRAVWELDVHLLRALLVFDAPLVELPDGVNLKHVCLQTPTTAPYSTSARSMGSISRRLCERLLWLYYRRRRQRLQTLMLATLDAFGVPNCACPKCAPFASEQGACRELMHEPTLAEFLSERRVPDADAVADAARRTTFARLLLEQVEYQKLASPERAPRAGRERLAWLEELLAKADAAQPPTADPRHRICMLSIDGGGVKGLVPIHLLLHLKKLFARCSPDDLLSKFNFLTGTSTGTIIACGLLRGLSSSYSHIL